MFFIDLGERFSPYLGSPLLQVLYCISGFMCCTMGSCTCILLARLFISLYLYRCVYLHSVDTCICIGLLHLHRCGDCLQ